MQCSFCEKQATTVRALVFAPSRAAICDECVDVCNDIIRDDDDPGIGPRCHLPRPSEIDSFVSTVRSRSWEELAHLLHAAKVAPPQRTQYCSFCDEPQDRVGKLVAGPGHFICDGCVALCNKEIAQTRDARLVELNPLAGPQVLSLAAMQRKTRKEAAALSAAERERVLDALRADVHRRRTTILLSMQIAARHADGAVPSVEAITADDRACECPLRYRELINSRAATWLRICLLGGTSVLRRRLAQRMHEASVRADRPLVAIDCRAPGALAGLADLDNATVFLDHIEVLSAEAQEFLGLTLCSDVPDAIRVVAGTSNRAEFAARVNDRRFSKALYLQICGVPVDLDTNQPSAGP